MKRQNLAIILITTAIITSSLVSLVLLTNTPVDPEEFDLSIAVIGSGCTSPSVGVHNYSEGTRIDVTATPSTDWTLNHWLLDSINVGSKSHYTVTMDSDHSLTAVFTEIPTYYLKVAPPVGNGEVYVNETRHVGDDVAFASGEVANITAVPAIGWTFSNWIFDMEKVGSENPYTVAINEDHNLTAVFTETLSLPLHYTFNVVNVYPHDESAFTQGLVFENGFLYEGTGLYGQSTLRRLELETGNIIQLHSLPDEFFGEGITLFQDKIIQLTWKAGKGFVYEKNSFELLQEFDYSTEGWGITHNGSALIMSDGTATLYFLDPETFQTISQVEVYDEEPINLLNELEYINGSVYANIWTEDKIAIINPQTGQVTGWIDLTGINDSQNQNTGDVLNGIAYDSNMDRLFVTGKLWSQLFEIELVPVE